ncbi:hypothetical protein Tco_1229275 [Tanacetum coccineum]
MLPNPSLILELLCDELKKLITHFIPMISLQLLIQHLCDYSSSYGFDIAKLSFFNDLPITILGGITFELIHSQSQTLLEYHSIVSIKAAGLLLFSESSPSLIKLEL